MGSPRAPGPGAGTGRRSGAYPAARDAVPGKGPFTRSGEQLDRRADRPWSESARVEAYTGVAPVRRRSGGTANRRLLNSP
jgi:hypothetical protein